MIFVRFEEIAAKTVQRIVGATDSPDQLLPEFQESSGSFGSRPGCFCVAVDSWMEFLVAMSADIGFVSSSWIDIIFASATAGTKLERERFDGAPGQACYYRVVGLW